MSSLRVRLLVAIGIIALLALAIADVVTYSALESFLTQQVDRSLEQSHGQAEQMADSGRLLVCGKPGTSPPAVGGSSSDPDGQSGTDAPSNAIEIQAVAIVTRTGRVVSGQTCPAYVDGSGYRPNVPSRITGFATNDDHEQVTYFTTPSTSPRGPMFRVRASILAGGDVLLVAQPLEGNAGTLHHLLIVELIVTGGAVVIALAAGLWLVRIGLRPLVDMERTAESIANGDLAERVPGENGNTEVGRLARSLNVMLSRIESAFSARVASERRLRASEHQLRQFVADASHELRTPISAISAYAELFGRGASEDKEDLARLMAGIRTETGRMEHLVSDLLLLARLDEGRPLERRSVDLVALCAGAVQTAVTVGPEWPITFEASRPVEVVGDETKLRQVVDNLLANVRSHTPAGTEGHVSVERDSTGVEVAVADKGPGMDPEATEHIFERFYRADPSRSREHGGTGLGLSIVHGIVAAHGGTVTVTSRPGAGTTFTLRLPLGQPPLAPEPPVDEEPPEHPEHPLADTPHPHS